MTVEVTSVNIQRGGVVTISCVDVSEENLQRIERVRDDGFQKEINLVIDTKDKKAFYSLRSWMLKQACTAGKKTWGTALLSVVGTITDLYGISRFRVRE